MYLKQIEQLVNLQKIDAEILSLETEIERLPKEITDLKNKHAQVERDMNLVLEKVEFLNNQSARLDVEADEDTARLKKSKNKAMAVSKAKEYNAIVREMDNLEKISRSKDEERAALKEELLHNEIILRETQKKLDELGEELESAQAGMDERIDEAKERLEVLKAERKLTDKIVPPPVLARYEFIRSRLSNPVIVPVDAGICSGCHISIPPQAFIELQKGLHILSCPNCQRLIFWSEHFRQEETKEEASEEMVS